jgi:hypothetical protein
MTNFLDRLAARALGVAPVAQPIIPSIFTPGPRSSGAQRPDAQAGETPEQQGEWPIPARELDCRNRRASPDRLSPADRTMPIADRPSASPSGTHDGLAAGDPEPELATIPWPDPGRVPGVAAGLIEPESLVAGAFPSPRYQGRVQPSEAGFTGNVPTGIPPAALATARGGPARANPPVSGWEASRTTPRAQDGPLPVPQSQAPAVRVVIGRIDVRAEFSTAPTPAAPPRPARSSPLSLEEYLRQRREGKR